MTKILESVPLCWQHFDVEVIALGLIELANLYLGEDRLLVIYGRVNGHRVTLLAGPGVCERIA